MRPRPVCLLAFVLVLPACTGSTTLVSPPPPPAGDFVLTFAPHPDDGATAAALGWGAVLPGLDVRLTPKDSSSAARTFQSSAAGTVTIPDLAEGDYVLEASRWLTDAERAGLSAGDDGLGFVTRTLLRATVASGGAGISVPASRRKGLVISEWSFNSGFTGVAGGYVFGGFLELYNNADTTVYLDGYVVGRALAADYDYPNFPCSLYAQEWSGDPAGVWSVGLQVFPGSGHDYPVLPGHSVVVATDAIDHRAFVPQAIDLSQADFEFRGPADVDNPAVPNMLDVGFDYLSGLLGHGLIFSSLGNVAYLAAPLDYPSLVLRRFPGTSETLHPRIPANRLLDVVAIRTNYYDSGYDLCARVVHPNFDRGEGFRGRLPASPDEYVHSVERKALPFRIGGQVILQHTRTSGLDFFRGDRTPGTVP